MYRGAGLDPAFQNISDFYFSSLKTHFLSSRADSLPLQVGYGIWKTSRGKEKNQTQTWKTGHIHTEKFDGRWRADLQLASHNFPWKAAVGEVQYTYCARIVPSVKHTPWKCLVITPPTDQGLRWLLKTSVSELWSRCLISSEAEGHGYAIYPVPKLERAWSLSLKLAGSSWQLDRLGSGNPVHGNYYLELGFVHDRIIGQCLPRTM